MRARFEALSVHKICFLLIRIFAEREKWNLCRSGIRCFRLSCNTVTDDQHKQAFKSILNDIRLHMAEAISARRAECWASFYRIEFSWPCALHFALLALIPTNDVL